MLFFYRIIVPRNSDKTNDHKMIGSCKLVFVSVTTQTIHFSLKTKICIALKQMSFG